MANLPIGTIIPYYSTDPAFTVGLSAQGWWICDGRTVTDQTADPYWINRATPNLTQRFLRGTTDVNLLAGNTGGSETGVIPFLHVKVETSGWDANKLVFADPRLLIYSAMGWVNGSPIVSTWTTVNDPAGAGNPTIPTVPPYFEVVYLIMVK